MRPKQRATAAEADLFRSRGRCYLKGHAGDAANAILIAAGHNFRRILAWLRALLRSILHALPATLVGLPTLNPAF